MLPLPHYSPELNPVENVSACPANGRWAVQNEVPPGDVILTKDHLAIGSVLGAPSANPPLQAAAQAVPIVIGMPTLHLPQKGDRPKTEVGFQHRADFTVPEPEEGIGRLATRS